MLFCEKLSTTKTELIFCFSCYMKINHCNLQPPPTFIQMQEILTPTSYPHPPLSNFYFSSKITAHNYEIIAVLNYVFRELYKKRTISVWTIHTQVLDRWRGGLNTKYTQKFQRVLGGLLLCSPRTQKRYQLYLDVQNFLQIWFEKIYKFSSSKANPIDPPSMPTHSIDTDEKKVLIKWN